MANKKCDLCGKDHEDWQAHVFEKQLVVDPGGNVRVERLTVANGVANKVANKKRDRKDYQREYMRKRRAKQE